MLVNETSIPQAINSWKDNSSAAHQPFKMVIAMCTLAVLLQQMQSVVAKPQFVEFPEYVEICESITVSLQPIAGTSW